MKFPDSAVRQILFDTLVEMGKLDSNLTDQPIKMINEIWLIIIEIVRKDCNVYYKLK